MPSARTLAWIERLAWILLYGGLFTVVLGLATLGRHDPVAWSLIVAGSVATVGGAVLIWVRSRFD
jgi:hypothetical protein